MKKRGLLHKLRRIIKNLIKHIKQCRKFNREHTVWVLEGKKDWLGAVTIAALTWFLYESLNLRTVHIPSFLVVMVLSIWLGKLEDADPEDE